MLCPRGRRVAAAGAVVLVCVGSIACQSTAAPASAPAPGIPDLGEVELAPVDLPELDERALLLLLVDRQIYEGFVVNQALEGSTQLRRELARTLGRIDAVEGRPILERLLDDGDRGVRLAALFSLGELEQPLAIAPVTRFVGGADAEAARLAIETLAKLGLGLEEVVRLMSGLDDREQAARLLPSLYRFDKRASLLLAARWLALDDPDLHAWAAYALARDAIPGAAVYLRSLTGDPDPWVRGWALRALGSVGEAADLDLVAGRLTDAEEGPVVHALRAGHRLIRDGATVPDGWRSELERLAGDPRPGVRMTALEAMASSLPHEGLSALLVERFRSGTPRERQVALLALAGGDDPLAAELTRLAAVDADPQLRRHAARAAVELELVELVLGLMSDPSPAVRADAIGAMLDAELRSGSELATLAIVDPSAAVRVAGLAWLIEHPELSADRIVQALRPVEGEDRVDLEIHVVRALSARTGTLAAETELILEALERLGRSEEFLVRREVGVALLEIGVSPLAVGPANEERTLESYQDIVLRTSRDRYVRLETDRGALTLRLSCPDAPLTCLSFLQLSEVGFFDGLPLHRVVPDFVVQGGDPSGGGWGGPGYSLRDEINRERFEVGAIGMAHAGPDTAGSQFFVTLSRQPHLDGGYTVFGRVVDGLEVLHRLEQDDRIRRMREVAAP